MLYGPKHEQGTVTVVQCCLTLRCQEFWQSRQKKPGGKALNMIIILNKLCKKNQTFKWIMGNDLMLLIRFYSTDLCILNAFSFFLFFSLKAFKICSLSRKQGLDMYCNTWSWEVYVSALTWLVRTQAKWKTLLHYKNDKQGKKLISSCIFQKIRNTKPKGTRTTCG